VDQISGNLTESDLSRQKKADTEFRNYTNSLRQNIVSQTYYNNHTYQTLDFVLSKKKQFLQFNHAKMTIWRAFELLETIVDTSDPDTDLPQTIHGLQTAEQLRKDHPDKEWLPLVGLIHDLGKVLAHPIFGSEPQWAVVGDTFVVGCAFSDKTCFPEFFKHNPDYTHPNYSTQYGIYQPHCGLDKLHLSWGHDEYMYQVCIHNNSTIPPEGLDMIRFHSFYAWHRDGSYSYLMSETDKERLKWVNIFNKCDLYTKHHDIPNVEQLKEYYQGLIKKYFPIEVLEW